MIQGGCFSFIRTEEGQNGRDQKNHFHKKCGGDAGYFSEQIALELERNGYETCFIDYERMYESMDVMLHFLDREETALVTFNFIGLRGESVFQTESGRSIWQEENLPDLEYSWWIIRSTITAV